MIKNFEELKAWRDDARRGPEREVELLREKEEQIEEYLRALDATDELLAEVDDLKGELEEKQQEADSLRQQVQEERERRLAAVVRLSELSKLSAGVAKKSSQDDMIKAMRSYLNTSKRKTLGKREAAKMVFTELLTSAKVELPEDITDLLEHLDDEQSEPMVVHVSGSYNDIHDNSSVDFRTEE